MADIPQTEANTKESVIRFDLREEKAIRERAQKEHNLAKNFKSAGLSLTKFSSASDPSVRKQFNLPAKTDLSFIEISLSGKPTEDLEKISQVKDIIVMMENVKILDDKNHEYMANHKVHRFLIRFV